MRKTAKRVIWAASIGTIYPAFVLIGHFIGMITLMPSWGIYLWPTSLILMATDGHESNFPFVAQVILISLASNAVIWVAAGLVFCWVVVDIPWRRII